VRKKSLSEYFAPERFGSIFEKLKQINILVVGDVILDTFICGETERISPEAPVPVVKVKKNGILPGTVGGAGNVALNIAAFGGNVFLLSAVGQDKEADHLRQILVSEGIKHFLIERKLPTITKTRVIARNQQIVRIDREEVEPLNSSEIAVVKKTIKEKIEQFDAVIISDYGKGFVTRSLIKDLLKYKKDLGRILIVDPKTEHFFYYKDVTCITPNRKEASEAMRRDEPREINDVVALGKKIFRKLACENLIITLGKSGMVVFEKGKNFFHIPSVARDVFDVTGAGDTVAGILTLALASGATILESAVIANLSAGIVVGKLGPGQTEPEEIKKFFKDWEKIFIFDKL
jgi:D-glycero-beta-D-manno-heptose-7-phosphate kinase